MDIKRLSRKLSGRARTALGTADRAARMSESSSVRPIHILSAIVSEDGSLGNLFLVNAGLKRDRIAKDSMTEPGRKDDGSVPFSKETKDVLTGSFLAANRYGSPYVGTEHILHAILSDPDEEIVGFLASVGMDRETILGELEAHLGLEHVPDFGKLLDLPETGLLRHAKTSHDLPPALAQFTVELGRESGGQEETFFGRDTEMARIANVLGRRQKNNPVLLGEPGVGKTAIVSAVADRIARGAAEPALLGKRVLALDLALVVAGTSFRGEFESRLKEIVREAKEQPDIILFIDELHTIVGAGNAQGGLDAANILKPALARGELRVIGATTPAEYRKHIEKDSALGRRFQPIPVREPSRKETGRLLRAIRPAYEAFHGISIGNDLLDLSIDLSLRHLHDRFLPDKAIDILDEASSLAKNRRNDPTSARTMAELGIARHDIIGKKELLISERRFEEASELLEKERKINGRIAELSEQEKKRAGTTGTALTARDLFETVSAMTGVPFSVLENDGPEYRMKRLGQTLRKRIASQEDAIRSVETILLRSLSETRDPERPLGSLLFLGPTGVGKTLLAKVVAEEFFGGPDRLIRIDMSEFTERHSMAQMIGAPAGYVGYGEGGKLTERIRRMPHAVVLFDEIEKAHPDVTGILLQILDEGTLTDAEGRSVSFRDALVVITSNIGTGSFSGDRIGFGKTTGAGSEDDALKELGRTLRPELLARIDRTVSFDPLDRGSVAKIVRLEISTLKRRLARRGVTVIVPPSVVAFVTEKSLAPEHGARLVRRNIEKFIGVPIAESILKGSGGRVVLSLSGEEIVCGRD